MLADPQSITPAGGSAQSMPRVETGGLKSSYLSADGNYKLTVSHQNLKRNGKSRVSTMERIDQRAIVPDPLTAVNDYETLSVWIVIDRPEVGFTAAQIDALVQGFKARLTTPHVGELTSFQS